MAIAAVLFRNHCADHALINVIVRVCRRRAFDEPKPAPGVLRGAINYLYMLRARILRRELGQRGNLPRKQIVRVAPS